VLDVALDQPPQRRDLGGVLDALEVHHLRVHARVEVAALVEHVGDAPGHAGREVAAGRTEHHHPAAGHVLAAVVAHALDHRVGAAVAHAEALARHAADVGLAARGTVQRHVADDDVVLGREGRLARREDGDLAARQPLADVVVGVALEQQRHARRDERAEALSGRAAEVQADVSSGSPFAP